MTSTAQPTVAAIVAGGLTVQRPLRAGMAWDDFIACAPESTFCHRAGWFDVMRDVLGHEPVPLVAVDGAGRWHGVLPLVRVRSRILGHRLLSMPFLNYGGPVGSPESVHLLVEGARRDAAASGAKSLELRARQPIDSPLQRMDRKVTVLLELPDSPDALFKSFPAKLRSQIRRPTKDGLTIRFGHDLVHAFHEVFAVNMRDLGTPVLTRRLFAALPDVFGDGVTFAAVFDGERPVAAGCGFTWREEFEITWASSLRSHARSAPNMLLYFGLMEHLAGRGVRVFNFGRCTPGGGTHKFKEQWGGTTVPLPWLHWSPEGGPPGRPAQDKPVFQLAVRAWQRLPLPVANALGPLLARDLP